MVEKITTPISQLDLIRKVNEIIEDTITVDTTLSNTSINPVQNKVIYQALTAKADITSVPTTISQLASTAQMAAINSGVNTTVVAQVTTNKNNIASIQTLIPSAATSTNQLADKAFVNSSISTNTANFIGTFSSVAELEAYSGTLTNNDYAFVTSTDSAGNTVYNRYKYNSTSQEWIFEYALNNSSFTSAQWAAINSNITSTLTAQITTNENEISTIKSTMSGYGDIVTHNVPEFATAAQGSLADSAIQPGDSNTLLVNDAGYQPNVLETIKVNGTVLSVTTKTVNITIPAAPTVNNANMVIKRNNTAIGTFTANQSSASTINISVPTIAADIGALPDDTFIPTVVDTYDSTGTDAISGTGVASAIDGLIKRTDLSATAPITYDNSTGVISANIDSTVGANTSYLVSSGAVKTYVDSAIVGGVKYQGVWTATSQTDYSSITLPVKKGYLYYVTGSATISGTEWNTGDFLLVNANVAAGGTLTDVSKIDNTESTDIVRLNATQTLTNKSIDASNNTISNLTTGNLKSGVLSTSVRATASASDTILVSELGIAQSLAGKADLSDLPTIDSSLSATSTNPVQNKVVTSAITNKTVATFTNVSAGTSATVSNLIINKVTSAEYATITPSDTELYFITDDSGITSTDITNALGYTPYSSANPSGYQANVLETVKVNGTALTPSSKTVNVTIGDGATVFKKNGTAFATATANQTSTINVDYTIPSEVTETTVSGWGFTKNIGTVTKVNNVSPDANGNVTVSAGSTVIFRAWS